MSNSKGKDDGWILCPSKTFRGKYYYFNLLNGEAVWSLSDTELSSLRRSQQQQRIAGPSHTYPEPIQPPTSDSPSTYSPQQMHDIGRNYQLQPMYSQSVPRYMSPIEPYQMASNLIWVPVQIPQIPSMYVPCYRGKRTSDGITQTNVPNQNQMRQTCKIPLSQRFSNYNQQEIGIDTPKFTRVRSKSMSDSPYVPMCYPTLGGEPLKRKLFNDKLPATREIYSKAETLKCTKTSECAGTQTDLKILHRRFSNGGTPLRVITDHLDEDTESAREDSTEIGIQSSSYINDNAEIKCLDKNDLRLLLIAKRKELCVEDEPQTNHVTCMAKKKVTFNDEPRIVDDVNDGHSNHKDVSQEIAPPRSDDIDLNGECYIVCDAETLLQDYGAVEKLLQYQNHTLLLPRSVKRLIEVSPKADPIAKRLALQCTLSTNQPDEIGATQHDRMIYFCTQAVNQKKKVILITNDTNLITKANLLNLKCCHVNQIESHVWLKDLKNWYISITNDKRKNIDKVSVPVETFRKLLFQERSKKNISKIDTGMKANNNNVDFIELSDTEDVLKKTIVSDRLIDITRKKTEINENESKIANLNFEKTNEIRKTVNVSSTGNVNPAANLKQMNFTNFRKTVVCDSTTETKPAETSKSFINNKKEFEKVVNKEIKVNFSQTNLNGKEAVGGKETRNGLEEQLKKYTVKNKTMEERIKSRFEEWVCVLTQTLEDCLTDVLLNNTIERKALKPLVFTQLLTSIQKTFIHNPYIKSIVDRMSTLWIVNSNNKDKLQPSIQPQDLMKIFGCALLLLEYLQSETPLDLTETIGHLRTLLKTIEDPSLDPKTPQNLTLRLKNTDDEDQAIIVRQNYVKSHSEVIQYLKKHHAAWADYKEDIHYEEPKPSQYKVIRTCGGKLHELQIHNNKNLTTIDKTNTETDIGNTETIKLGNTETINPGNTKIIEATILDIEVSDNTVIIIEDTNGNDKERIDDLNLMQRVLTKELCCTLKRISVFICNTVNKYRTRNLVMNDVNQINCQAVKSLHFITQIIHRLERIIERENEKKLPHALAIITHQQNSIKFKQFITKCVIQASTLENALQLVITLTGGGIA